MRTSGLVALALLAASTAGCHRASADPPKSTTPLGEVWLTSAQASEAKVVIAPVEERSIDDNIVTSGRVVLDDLRSGHVFSPVSGRVVKINASLGQRVKKGEPLAIIESPDIGSAVSDVHKAEADLIAAQHDFERKKDLAAQHAASAADVETAEDNYRKSRAELERARQKAFLLRAGNVDAVTQTFTLTSPLEGEVLLRNITPGVEVQGQYGGGTVTELFTVGEVDKVWVLGDLYERDLGRVKVGAPATVAVVTYADKVFSGTVDWVSGMLDPNTRTAKVRCTFDNPEHLLRPEMFATMAIAVDKRKAVAIPRDAVVHMGDYDLVFVQSAEGADPLKLVRLPVDVDRSEPGAFLPVLHGLEVGQRIAIAGAAGLSQRM